MNKQHVFIIGSKGIPSQYGGFETFVDRLTEYEEIIPYDTSLANQKFLHYHVACRTGYEDENYEYHSAECFPLKVPAVGPASAIVYDLLAIRYVVEYIETNAIENPYVYILASRIGPFIKKYVKRIHKLGGRVYLNPDGFEWKRAKWSGPVRAYWKMSTGQMVKHADYIICDSEYIRQYICDNYRTDHVYYIPYGADVEDDSTHKTRVKYRKWLKDNGLTEGQYFLTVSRLVPENNFKTMIMEYMDSGSDMPFALITTVNDAMKASLESELKYSQDDRIRFLPVVYDRELLSMIRRGSFAYFHGHEVGGTNPSLLEALAAGVSGSMVLALDVAFNREVCGLGTSQGAYYWTKEKGNLKDLINAITSVGQDISEMPDGATITQNAVERIRNIYNWEKICITYRDLFLNDGTGMYL